MAGYYASKAYVVSLTRAVVQELKEKEAGRAYRVVSFSLSKAKAAAGDLIKAVKALASKGKGYLILLLFAEHETLGNLVKDFHIRRTELSVRLF